MSIPNHCECSDCNELRDEYVKMKRLLNKIVLDGHVTSDSIKNMVRRYLQRSKSGFQPVEKK